MARVEVEKEWLVRRVEKGFDAAIDRVVERHGMSGRRSADELDMRGGSQTKMRLMGGAFVKDTILPKGGTLGREVEPSEPGVERIALHLEDRMGMGFMTPLFKQKYERILEDIASSVEAVITENTAAMKDALDPSATWTDISAVGGSAAPPREPSTAEELERLARLHEGGLLSADEFEAAKQKLLG